MDFEETIEMSSATKATVLSVTSFIALLFASMSFFQIAYHHPLGNNPAPDWLLLTASFITTMIVIFFLSFKCQTRLSNEGVFISFRPYFKRVSIPWDKISSITYFRHNYPGDGIQYDNLRNAKVYSIGNGICVLIEHNDGEKNMIFKTNEFNNFKNAVDSLKPSDVRIQDQTDSYSVR